MREEIKQIIENTSLTIRQRIEAVLESNRILREEYLRNLRRR